MKKITIYLMIILFAISGLMNKVLAQAPEEVIYQAEARDSKGNRIKNQALDVKINIIQDSYTGSVVNEELHKINTSNEGMFLLTIGQGTNITVSGKDITKSPYVEGVTKHAIGDSYQGGIIFWLDATRQHGLIAATVDQSTGIQWYNGAYRYTGTLGDSLYAGTLNTTMIVATQMADNRTGNFAAKVCADYSVTVGGVTYDDWYLPSKVELNLLYLQKDPVGGFSSGYYWSSSGNRYSAWIQGFSDGTQINLNKNYAGYVRAVRAF